MEYFDSSFLANAIQASSFSCFEAWTISTIPGMLVSEAAMLMNLQNWMSSTDPLSVPGRNQK
jgi:hypothetical protein